MRLGAATAEPAQVWSLEQDAAHCASSTVIRRIVAQGCLAWGLSGDQADDAAVAVYELATNALIHGAFPQELRRYNDPPSWAVLDCGGGFDVVEARLVSAQHPDADALLSDGGRGLLIVANLFPGACSVLSAVTGDGREGKEVRLNLERLR